MDQNNALLNEERLKMVIEGNRIGFWEWNLITGEVERNNHWTEMLGYSVEDFNNDADAWTMLLHQDDKERVWKEVYQHLTSQDEFLRIEYRMRTHNGDYKWILDIAKVVQRDSNGKPVRMCGTHMDITEQKRHEEEREKLINSLQNALNEIKILKGILPICLYCHNIRDENGNWERIESYIVKNSNAQFSHGICPKCMVKARKDYGLDED